MNTDIYLMTAFAFISCDGEIASEEIELLRDMHKDGTFPGIDVDSELEKLVAELNKEGKNFLKSYLLSVNEANLSKEDSLKLLKIAVKTIYADNDVAYSEVKFFRVVRQHLNAIDDDYILENIPEIEDFWLASDIHADAESIEKDYFNNIELPQFNIGEIETKNELLRNSNG